MFNSSAQYREAIRAGFKAYSVKQGDLKSHLVASYIDYFMSDRQGLAIDIQVGVYIMAHTVIHSLMRNDPDDSDLADLHGLIIMGHEFVAARALDSDAILEGSQQDFDLWAAELKGFPNG